MRRRKLYIFVEGHDDVWFFERIVKPHLVHYYRRVFIIQHARLSTKKKYNYIRSMHEMRADYLFVVDIDYFPCVRAKKEDIVGYLRIIDSRAIVVVIKEIESWYLAGIGNHRSRKLQLPVLESTDDITKEDFNALIPPKFRSRRDFMNELLKHYDITIAIQKNKSFAYFWQ
ncbi:MAG: hypothetical protein A2Y62_07125 [Candidatus Fischerbacteria bacterium RBG_13_37_8]|uniref:DUF4276 family protein n=1 Tax=Candidatus Fischerbacteria bacterium RBG_13_37_8 TaxID=1817863 RepID=A0A1F5VUW2_9BACT|nr:MAG: hypothetical protein A2Y62_07125 [Candidatus Fischerbacteria bacterium RBG_13_37_8]